MSCKKFRIRMRWNDRADQGVYVIDKRGWFFWYLYESIDWLSYEGAKTRLAQICSEP